MKRFIYFSGYILLFGSIVLILYTYPKIKVQYQGTVVQMKIESLPSFCMGSKFRYAVKYSYENKIYEKQLRGNYCQEHDVGEMVPMRVLQGSETILFPHESIVRKLISLGLLALFGLGLIIMKRPRAKK